MIPIPAGGDGPGPHDPVVSRLLDMITLALVQLTERPNTPSAVLIDQTRPPVLFLWLLWVTCRFHITHDLHQNGCVPLSFASSRERGGLAPPATGRRQK